MKFLEENIGKPFSDTTLTNVFLGQSRKAIEIKAKINKRDLNLKILHSKRNHKQNKMTAYRLGETICKYLLLTRA